MKKHLSSTTINGKILDKKYKKFSDEKKIKQKHL